MKINMLNWLAIGEPNSLTTVVVPNNSRVVESLLLELGKDPMRNVIFGENDHNNGEIKFANGSRIQFRVFEKKEDAQGMQRDFLYYLPDDKTDPEVKILLEMRTRLLVLQSYNR